MTLINNLKEHWRKYAVLAISVCIALSWAFRRVSYEVRRNNNINESVLRLTPRNIIRNNSSDSKRNGGDLRHEPGRGRELDENHVGPYIPQETEVRIISDGPVRLEYNKFGFTFRPGLQFAGGPIRGVGLDAKLFYYNRVGIGVGLLYMPSYYVMGSPTLWASYRLDKFKYLKNTEAVGGAILFGNIPYIGLRLSL